MSQVGQISSGYVSVQGCHLGREGVTVPRRQCLLFLPHPEQMKEVV